MLRRLHLYLGCVFAPMLMFFAISGFWQTLGLQWSQPGRSPSLLSYLSTIHTGRGLKVPGISTLYSTGMKWFVLAMTVSFALTIILGIIMAFRFGHKRTATGCLLAGVGIPLALVLLALSR